MKTTILLAMLAGMAGPCFAQQIHLRETTPKPAGGLHFKSAQLPDGDVLVFGGAVNGVDVVATSWRYDWETETWSEAPSLAFPVAGMAVTTLSNGDILCVGGTDDFAGKVQRSQRFDVAAGQWAASAGDFEFFNPIYTGHSVVTLPDDYVLVTTTNGNLAIFHPGNNTWTEIDPGPLDAGGRPMIWLEAQNEVFFPAAGGQIYIPDNPPFTGDLFYLDPPQPLFTSAVVKLADERVVTMDLGFNFDNDVSIYDPVTRTAAIVSEVPYNGGGGSRNAILMADGRVLTFGFGDITTPGDTKLVEVYDATANEWEVGTYSGVGPVGFPLLHLLPDSSVFAISTNPENIGQDIKNRCWIINRDDMTPATEVRTEQFRLSPNPASDWLIVDGLKGENIDLSLFHPDGKMAARWENVAGRVDLKSRHLAPGLYFFNIEKMEGGIWQSGKIILQ